MNQPVSVAFKVTDETPSSVSLSAQSSNQAVVANNSMTFSGSDSSRSLAITPSTGAVGIINITITATNQAGRKGSTSFRLEVRALPTLEYYPKLTASDGTAGANFGRSVAISGEYAVVGAHLAGSDSSGAAYVFQIDDDASAHR